jgi:hypothetical protein
MSDDFKSAGGADELPVCTNEEFEIGYRSEESASPFEICIPELALEAAGYA